MEKRTPTRPPDTERAIPPPDRITGASWRGFGDMLVGNFCSTFRVSLHAEAKMAKYPLVKVCYSMREVESCLCGLLLSDVRVRCKGQKKL